MKGYFSITTIQKNERELDHWRQFLEGKGIKTIVVKKERNGKCVGYQLYREGKELKPPTYIRSAKIKQEKRKTKCLKCNKRFNNEGHNHRACPTCRSIPTYLDSCPVNLRWAGSPR